MSVQLQISKIVANVGRQGLHSLYPNEFEYYLIALELVDSRDNTVDFLTFPVLPDSISRNHSELVNIRKTQSTVTSIHTTSHVPIEISMSGTFGRQLKLLVGNKQLNFVAMRHSVKNNIWNKSDVHNPQGSKSQSLSNEIKTGYGATKILQAIIEKSSTLDSDNKPFKLYLYNSVYGENFIVKAKSLNVFQNKDQFNAMWNYQLSLTCIAPLNQTSTKKFNVTAFSYMQSQLNALGRIARTFSI